MTPRSAGFGGSARHEGGVSERDELAVGEGGLGDASDGEVPFVGTFSEGGEGAGGGGAGGGEGVPELGHGGGGVAGRDENDLLGVIVKERLGLVDVGVKDGGVGRLHVRHDLGEGGAAVVAEGPGHGADVGRILVVGDIGGARLLVGGGGDPFRRGAGLGRGGVAARGISGVGRGRSGVGGGRSTGAGAGVGRVVADDGHFGECLEKYLNGK